MDKGLKTQAIDASVWRGLQSISTLLIGFVVQVILARLLSPKEFGLIAMIWVFIAVTETFVTSGYGSALIQRQRTEAIDESSVFYFNIAVSILGFTVLWLAAPWIAKFYREPFLTTLVRVVSFVLIIGAFGHVQVCLLSKAIDFKTQFRMRVAAGFVSGAMAITMAVLGFGVWSLVVLHLSRTSVQVLLAWFYSTWRPRLVFSFHSLRSMFAFGSNLLFSSLLESVYRNIYVAVIGRLFSATQLAFYSRADRLQQLPSQSVTSVVGAVALPVFARVQGDMDRFKSGLYFCLQLLVFAAFPAMTVLAMVASPLVAVLLTDKWLPSVPYLRPLCVVGALYPVHNLYAKVLLALGRSRQYLAIQTAQKIIITLCILITYRWGIMGLIVGQIAGWAVCTGILVHAVSRLIHSNPLRQLRAVLPGLVLSSLLGVTLYAVGRFPFVSRVHLLGCQVFLAAVVMLVFTVVVKPPAVVDLWGHFRKRLPIVSGL